MNLKFSLNPVNVISVDLNWNPNGRRIAVAVADEDGNVRAVIGGLGDNELLCFIKDVYLKRNTPSLILLDIPIEGCESLKCPPFFRPVDLALIRNGFPLLPSSKAGQRGGFLKKKIHAITGKSVRIYEIYPYAVYKFLSYLCHKGVLSSLISMTRLRRAVLLDEHFRTFRPPRYKREPNRRIRVKNMRYVFSLLTNPQIGLTFLKKGKPKTYLPLPPPYKGGDKEEVKGLLPAPYSIRGRAESLSTLTDKYDACLGAVVGIHLANKSPFAKIVGDKESGEILLLADKWLADNLKRTNIKVR